MDAAFKPSVPALGPVKPRLRGVIHQWSFFVALVAGAVLVVLAPSGRATAAAAIYAAALAGLLGTSALYHRVTWRPAARAWMRRLDHSMIFVLIAGTYTPFAVLVLTGSTRTRGAGGRLGRRPGRASCSAWCGTGAQLAVRGVLRGARLVRGGGLPADLPARGRRGRGAAPGRRRGLHGRRRGVRAASDRIRAPPSSATTRCSTCSWWWPPSRTSWPWRRSRYPPAKGYVL